MKALKQFQTEEASSRLISTPLRAKVTGKSLLTVDAQKEIAQGSIPDLRRVCAELFKTFYLPGSPYAATQFIPVLRKLEFLDQEVVQRFLQNPGKRHVLVENELMKVVLIHWKSGEISSIHGHPKGGCVFKILQGSLEELRYTADASPKLLSVSKYQEGSMAYIDDNMGHHAVGNPFDMPAISLHVYTPGKK